jgi:TRAP-type C4-dicarboxylate transport system substrate-binding protein
MKKAWIFAILAVVVFPLSSAVAADKPIKLIFESCYPATHSRLGDHTPLGDFLNAMEKDSGGRIKLERHWGGEPVPKKETLEGVSKGVIDLLFSAQSYYSGKIAIADHGIMPKNFRTNADVYDIWYNSPVGNMIDGIYQKRANVKLLTPWVYSNYSIQVGKRTKKIRKFEDFKGLKIRSPGGMASLAAKGIGASPVLTIGGDYYTAMQRGTIDAGMMPMYSLEAYKMWEVCDQIVYPPIFNNCFVFIWMNLDKWKKLGPELQQIVMNIGRKLETRQIAFIAADDVRIEKIAREKGVDFYTLPPEDTKKMYDAVDNVWDLYIERNTKQGLGAEAKKIREIVQKRFNYEWF